MEEVCWKCFPRHCKCQYKRHIDDVIASREMYLTLTGLYPEEIEETTNELKKLYELEDNGVLYPAYHMKLK